MISRFFRQDSVRTLPRAATILISSGKEEYVIKANLREQCGLTQSNSMLFQDCWSAAYRRFTTVRLGSLVIVLVHSYR